MNRKRALIYGAGQCGKMARTYLKKDLDLIGFADRRKELQGGLIDGLPVVDPEVIPEYDPDLILIAVLNAEQNQLIIDYLVENAIKQTQQKEEPQALPSV